MTVSANALAATKSSLWPRNTRQHHTVDVRNGSAKSTRLAAAILETEGAISRLGLVGDRVKLLPIFPFVSGEKSHIGSF